MSNEPPRPDATSDEALQWLDGLAGKPASGLAHDEGALLRQALMSEDSIEMPPWTEIERRAAENPLAAAARLHNVGEGREGAANRAHRLPWAGIAAGLLLASAVALMMWPDDRETGWRGGGQGANADAVWRVAQPQQAASALVAELQALGAKVEQQADGPGARLHITASGPVATAVNRRLAALEAALDSQGSLILRVTAP